MNTEEEMENSDYITNYTDYILHMYHHRGTGQNPRTISDGKDLWISSSVTRSSNKV